MDGVTTMVEVGQHRIEATVFGDGLPAVIIEPAFGGNARAWRPIAEALAGQTTVVTYNRAPYGASSPAADGRTPGEVADDLHAVLGSLSLDGPLVLVGHSLGGVYVRSYAARHMEQVAGMVLVDSSHEEQGPILHERFSARERVLVALTVPQLIVRSRRWRGGADRRSIIREYRMFLRLGAGDTALTYEGLGDRPLIVVTRGPSRGTDADRLWLAWCDLQRDLARLSANSRHIISDSPDHYLNKGDPELLVSAIIDVVSSVRSATPLDEEPVAASDGD